MRACRGPLGSRAAAARAPHRETPAFLSALDACGHPGSRSSTRARWTATRWSRARRCRCFGSSGSLTAHTRPCIRRTPLHPLWRLPVCTPPPAPVQVERVPWLQVFDPDHATRLASQPAGVSDAAGSKCPSLAAARAAAHRPTGPAPEARWLGAALWAPHSGRESRVDRE